MIWQIQLILFWIFEEMINMNTQEKATKIYKLLKAEPGITILRCSYNDYNGALWFWFKDLLVQNDKNSKIADCLITPTNDNTYSIKVYQIYNMVESTIIKEIHNIAEENLRDTLDKIRTGELGNDNIYLRYNKPAIRK